MDTSTQAAAPSEYSEPTPSDAEQRVMMDRGHVYQQVFYVAYAAGINQQYHQILAWRFSMADRCLKITTGLLATLGAITAFQDTSWLGAFIAVLAAFAAVALNVVPLGEWGQNHQNLFSRWNDLLEEAELYCGSIPAVVGKECAQQMLTLVQRFHRLNALESSKWDRLFDKCTTDEDVRRGLVTPVEPPEGQAASA